MFRLKNEIKISNIQEQYLLIGDEFLEIFLGSLGEFRDIKEKILTEKLIYKLNGQEQTPLKTGFS